MIEWRESGTAADGVAYETEGAQAMVLRWGKGTYVHAYVDTESLAATCERMAAAGVEEASAQPII